MNEPPSAAAATPPPAPTPPPPGEPPVTLDELRTIDLFEELSDEQLAEWIPVARAYLAPAGHVIAEQGEETRGMQLLLRGDAQASIVDGDGSEPVGKHKAPTWMGAIATLTGGSLGVRMQAETDCRLPPDLGR